VRVPDDQCPYYECTKEIESYDDPLEAHVSFECLASLLDSLIVVVHLYLRPLECEQEFEK